MIDTALIGSIPRPNRLIESMSRMGPLDPEPENMYEAAVLDTISRFAGPIPLEPLGITDDCGFAHFSDDATTSHDTGFAKTRARVEGTALASRELGLA